MKYHFLLILLFFSMFTVACSIKERGNSMVYGGQFYIPELEREALVIKATDGDGYSAYRLAQHEGMFGDIRESLKWYKRAYQLDYKRESSFKRMTSIEENIKAGVYDTSTRSNRDGLDIKK